MKKIFKITLLMFVVNSILYSKIVEIDQVINIALENNLQIKIAEEDSKITENKKGQTNALYKPKLKLTGGYVHFNEIPDIVQLAIKLEQLNNGLDKIVDGLNSALGGSLSSAANSLSQVELENDGLNYASVKVSFEQPLYTGGKITALNKQVDISSEISQLEKKKTFSDIVFETKKSYYNVVLAKRTLETVKGIYKDIEQHVKEANSYFKAGLAPELDVIRAKAKLSEINQKIVQAENAVNVTTAYLNFIIGKDLPEDFEPNENINIDFIPENYEFYEKEALKNRIELSIYEKKIQLAKENKNIIKSQNKPTIALQGEYKYEGVDLSEEDPEWQVGIVGSLNIYDGGSINSQIKEANINIEKVNNGKDLVINNIKIEVKKAYLDMINSLENIKVVEMSLNQAKEANRMSQVNYSAGTGSSMERMDAEVFLEQMKNSYDNAINQYIVSKYNLEKAIGIYY